MRLALLLLAASISACSAAPRTSRLSGTWEFGFEHNRFRAPHQTYEQGWGWCFDRDSPAWDALFANHAGDFITVALEVEVEGVVSGPSPEGSGYGHLGLCDREVNVTRVIRSELIEGAPTRRVGD
jgi:hypothetical protein